MAKKKRTWPWRKPRCGALGRFYVFPNGVATWPMCFKEPGHTMHHRDAHGHLWINELGDVEIEEPKTRGEL